MKENFNTEYYSIIKVIFNENKYAYNNKVKFIDGFLNLASVFT